jgi:ATP-dependent DNA ligase
MPTISWTVPTGPQWAIEIKHDGFRFICNRDGDRVCVYSRRGIDTPIERQQLPRHCRRSG